MEQHEEERQGQPDLFAVGEDDPVAIPEQEAGPGQHQFGTDFFQQAADAAQEIFADIDPLPVVIDAEVTPFAFKVPKEPLDVVLLEMAKRRVNAALVVFAVALLLALVVAFLWRPLWGTTLEEVRERFPHFCSMATNYVKIEPNGEVYPCCRGPRELLAADGDRLAVGDVQLRRGG